MRKMKEKYDYRFFFILMLGLTLLGAATALVSPLLLQAWAQDEAGFTEYRILLLLLVMTLSMLLDLLLTVLREKFAKQYNIRNFQRFMRKYFRMSYDEITGQGAASLVERIQQAVLGMYEFMTGSFIDIWASALILAAVLVILASQSLVLAGILLLMLPVNYFGYRLLNRELRIRSETLQRENAEGFSVILSMTAQTDYLKQCSDWEELLRQMKRAEEQIYGSMADINIVARGASRVLEAVNDIARTMLMAFTVLACVETGKSPVLLVLTTVLCPMYFSHLTAVTRANLNRQGMLVSGDFIRSMDERREPDGTKKVEHIERIGMDIKTLAIGNKVLAKNISGEFCKGDVVWIRGESGAGKSTLAKMLLKFRPCEGIFINGEPIGALQNASLRERIDYLSQNVPIIRGSLLENLFYNKKWSVKAQEQLLAEPVLQKILQDRALDSPVEEGGANFSGGEKQKLALARMLQDEADVLILDEVTSNIDKESAAEILERVMEFGREKIIFIISHDSLPEKYATKSILLQKVGEKERKMLYTD